MRSLWILCFVLTLILFSPNAQAQEYRTWTSKNGAHKLEAKLVDNKDGILFLKKRDGETIEVELSGLSARDNDFIKNLKSSAAGPAVAAGPARIDDAETKTRPLLKSAKELKFEPLDEWNLTPDPFKTTLSSDISVVDLDMEHVFGTMAISPDRSVLYACYRISNLKMHVQKVDLLTGNKIGTHLQIPDLNLLDVSPDKKVFMAIDDRGIRGKSLSVVHYGEKIHPIVSFQPYGNNGNLAYARFVDNDHFLTVSEKGLMGLWNIKTLKLLWRTNVSSRPALSPNRKLLFVHLNQSYLAALDPLTGEVKGMRPAKLKGVSELCVNDSFTKLVGAGMGTCRVWDLKTGNLEADFSISGTLRNCSVSFVNDHQILVGHVHRGSNYKSSSLFDLVDLNLQCSMWAYGFDPAPAVGLGGKIWMQPQKSVSDPEPELACTEIPHAEAAEAINATSFDELTRVGAGKSLSMNMTYNSEAWNQTKIEENTKKFLSSLGFEMALENSDPGFDAVFDTPSTVRDRNGTNFVQDLGNISILFKLDGETVWRADHTREFLDGNPVNRELLFDNPWVGWVFPKTFRFYKPVLDGSKPIASSNGPPTFEELTYHRDYSKGFSWGTGTKQAGRPPSGRPTGPGMGGRPPGFGGRPGIGR